MRKAQDSRIKHLQITNLSQAFSQNFWLLRRHNGDIGGHGCDYRTKGLWTLKHCDRRRSGVIDSDLSAPKMERWLIPANKNVSLVTWRGSVVSWMVCLLRKWDAIKAYGVSIMTGKLFSGHNTQGYFWRNDVVRFLDDSTRNLDQYINGLGA